MVDIDHQIPALGAHKCPLCGATQALHWHRRGERDYWCCQRCQLVSVPVQQHVSAELEKAEYDRHENTLDDVGYRRFLGRTFYTITDRMPPGCQGLDFGCGPGPALAAMLEEAGYPVALYDLYYRPDSEVLQRRFHFITLTEVIEHLAEPAKVLSQLWQQLLPGGLLVIQTQQVRDQAAFRQWRYIHDPTHIAFYAPATFRWMAQWLEAADLEIVTADVVALRKAGALGDESA
ncbi:hypothetical protein BGP77_00760 [Saccharospirillum sp. MSK14-1]|nr:hypothetical protein BGP77_00760 [Saccharospirillum sp. MSK14-1]